MHPYVFSDTQESEKFQINNIINTIKKITAATNTENLVVSTYLISNFKSSFGAAYIKSFSKNDFTTNRGKWHFTPKWPVPDTLPLNYSLIRICIGLNIKFPVKEIDKYGWNIRFESLYDKIAFILAHELHHYRRYHLFLHKGEGEQSANKWALQHSNKLGFNVSGKKLPSKQMANKPNKFALLFDPYRQFRQMDKGNYVRIIRDPKNMYKNEFAVVVKPIRKNSKRMVIETKDGKRWRWPMGWLTPLRQSKR